MNRGLWNTSLFLLIIGLLMTAAGRAAAVYEQRRHVLKGKAKARVIRLIRRDVDGAYRTRLFPVFEFYANGKLYKVRDTRDCSAGKYTVNQEIPIRYDPLKPTRWQPDEESILKRYYPQILMYGGLILIMTGVFAFIRYAMRG